MTKTTAEQQSRIDSGREWLTLPFPLDSGFTANLTVPRDLKAYECERLCACLRSLVQPETP